MSCSKIYPNIIDSSKYFIGLTSALSVESSIAMAHYGSKRTSAQDVPGKLRGVGPKAAAVARERKASRVVDSTREQYRSSHREA